MVIYDRFLPGYLAGCLPGVPLSPAPDPWQRLRIAKVPETKATPGVVRVTVSLKADGSRTTYQSDPRHHAAAATTMGKDGKLLGRIHYVLDDAGRLATGEVYGPDEEFRFKTIYKYNAPSREAKIGRAWTA